MQSHNLTGEIRLAAAEATLEAIKNRACSQLSSRNYWHDIRTRKNKKCIAKKQETCR